MNQQDQVQRLDLVQRIKALDLQLGEKLAEEQGRTRRITASDYSFPWSSLILALALAGWWLFGAAMQPAIHARTESLAMILAAIVGAVTVLLAIRYIVKKVFGKKGNFSTEESSEAANIRAQRDALKRELVELDKRIGYKG